MVPEWAIASICHNATTWYVPLLDVSFAARCRRCTAEDVYLPCCDQPEANSKQGAPYNIRNTPVICMLSRCSSLASTNAHQLTSPSNRNLTISSLMAQSACLTPAQNGTRPSSIQEVHLVDRSPGLRISALPGTATANTRSDITLMWRPTAIIRPSSPSEASPFGDVKGNEQRGGSGTSRVKPPPRDSALTSHSSASKRGRECVKRAGKQTLATNARRVTGLAEASQDPRVFGVSPLLSGHLHPLAETVGLSHLVNCCEIE
jgi:hypothetical protein